MKSKSSKSRGDRTTKPPKEQKLSRTYAPAEISPIEWQRVLRRQFGREQTFEMENIGSAPFFSEFRVSNPQSKSTYRVAILGKLPGDNFCACPDYTTNELGTCKHIEFALAQLEKNAVPSRLLHAAITRRSPSCICATMVEGQSIFVPERIARRRC